MSRIITLHEAIELKKIVTELIADSDDYSTLEGYTTEWGRSMCFQCNYCYSYLAPVGDHDDTCPVARAKALLKDSS